MVNRRRPEQLPFQWEAKVLDAMGRCRRVLLDAKHDTAYHSMTSMALRTVIEGIDMVAKIVTGHDSYYAIDGTTSSPGRPRWRDCGS